MTARLRMWQVLVCVIVIAPLTAQAQDAKPLEVGVGIIGATVNELDTHQLGLSGRLGWRPGALVGVEAELGYSPSDLPETGTVSSSQTEFAAGATVGPRLGSVRPFGRLRAGVLRLSEASEPVACILIFPPPLSCQLAGGRTLAMLDIGGGVEIAAGPRSFLRLDLSDRLLRFPGPAFDRDRHVHDTDFWGHDLRVALGIGFRFGGS